MYTISQTIYLISDMDTVVIHSIESSDRYNIQKSDASIHNVSYEELTDDKDLIIKKLSIKCKQLTQDYYESREAWWRLKDETQHYKTLYLQKKNANLKLSNQHI